MNQALFPARATAVLAAFAFSLSGCSGGGLAGDIITGRVIGGEDEARIRLAATSTRVEADGGEISVEISNIGEGQMNWSASVDSSWARIRGDASGEGPKTITLVFEANAQASERTVVLSVTSEEASNSPQTVAIAQTAAEPEPEPVPSLKASADSYTVSANGGRITVELVNEGGGELDWSAQLPSDASWVRLLGMSAGRGDGSIQIEVDTNPATERRSFQLTVTAEGAEQSPQTLHFSQDYEAEQSLTLRTDTRHIGAGGETVEVRLDASSGGLVYWVASLDVDWAHLEGATDGEIDGNGAAVIRIMVDANPGQERSFTLSVDATNARTPQPLVFRQAEVNRIEVVVPAPPPPPAWYANDCQRQTPGFEEFGGWLAERGHFLNVTDSRVWRHMTDGHESNDLTLRTFTDCTEDKRTLTTSILADAMLDEPVEFANLPVGADARIILLDTVIPTVGEHRNGARHEDPKHVWSDAGSGWYPTFTRSGAGATFLHLQPLGDWGYNNSSGWQSQTSEWNAAGSDMSAWTDTAREYGWRLPSIQERTGEGLRMLANADTSLWLLVGGYTGTGSGRRIHPNSAVCGEAKQLCLFAPWEYQYTDAENTIQIASGTAVAAAQVAAALDNVLLLWPDYDLLDLRDLVFGCAEDLGDEGPDAMWGRGALSFNCLFTAQGDLRDPRTNTILSGGIFGPIQGLGDWSAPPRSPTNVYVPGIDRTGREFSYPLLRWSYRENHALLVAAGMSGESHAASLSPARRSHGATLLQDGPFSARIAASGDALGAVAQWRAGGFLTDSGLWTLRGGLALQQEGAGSLRGERVFRAPATLSGTFSIAFQHNFMSRLSLHFQGNYWLTLDTRPRSLWAGAQLSELRASAAIAYESSAFKAVMQAQYGGGLSGRLDVAGRAIRLTPDSTRHLSLRIRIPFRVPQA